MKKISYYDLQNTPISELKKQHKATSADIERQVRRQMDGATMEQRVELYRSVYDQKHNKPGSNQ